MATCFVENGKFLQRVDQASREKLDFKAITFRFFQGDFPSERAAFPKKEKFVNNVPLIIPVRIRLCPARQRHQKIRTQHSILVVTNAEPLQRD